MAKPILIIRMPEGYNDSFEAVSKGVRKQFNNEYHVLVVGGYDEELKFEVLNVDKEPEIKYSELKKLIKKETVSE